MTEILTESFCERCGTRYTFESKSAGSGRGRGFRALSSGLKNFVLSDDTSLGDAMAAARSDQEREVTNQQLDAFHKTFNFCMSCRQYTCSNCWNEEEGRCLTCSPHLGHEVLPAPFPTLDTPVPAAVEAEADRPRIAAEAWPALDLTNGSEPTHVHAVPTDAGAAEPGVPHIAADADVAEPLIIATEAAERPIAADADVAEPEVAAVASSTPETVGTGDPVESWADLMAADALRAAAQDAAADGTTRDAATDPATTDLAAADPAAVDVAAVAASRTRSLLGRFRPGQNVDAEIEAFEQHAEPAYVADAPGSTVDERAIEGTPELVVEAAADPVVEIAAQPSPEVAAEVIAEPIAEIAAEPVVDVPAEPSQRTDVVEQPVWRIVAPDDVGASPAPPERRPSAPPTGEPQWPTVTQDRLDFLRRPRTTDDVWAASTEDLFAAAPAPLPGAAAPVAIQSCSSCGLSLSATARFCRRCGTRQG